MLPLQLLEFLNSTVDWNVRQVFNVQANLEDVVN